jgi:alpha-D-ribose 1-methylphosphonate 5-triphosphate synthase subunit PhnL
MHDNDRLRVPSELQELSDHVSTGGQATRYDKSDREFIDDYPIIWVIPH